MKTDIDMSMLLQMRIISHLRSSIDYQFTNILHLIPLYPIPLYPEKIGE
jgi:hypothetical protein